LAFTKPAPDRASAVWPHLILTKSAKEAAMKLRTRKAIGTFLTVSWIAIYSLIIGAVGSIMVMGRGMTLELPFYVIAGFGWVPIEMLIIKWMSKPDA
jgi:Protein of unknown function (DUF2842)